MANDVSDAVDREAAWLQSTDGGMPNLLTPAGGPFDIVQGYMPRTPPLRKPALYLTLAGATGYRSVRFANLRRLNVYDFRAVIWWPLTLSTGKGEDEQRAFAAAIAATVTRIIGPAQDKTHGGRFLQVGEDPDHITVDMPTLDPDTLGLLGSDAVLKAAITYAGADPDFNA